MAMSAILIFAVMPSCKKATIASDVVGEATAVSSSVQNGDEIILSISGIISASGSINYDGEQHFPIVHYLIDGVEVAVSSETEIPFNALYKVENLTLGEHTLSVDITPSHGGDSYNNKVVSSIITVIE